MLPKKALFIVLAVTLAVIKQPVSLTIGDQQIDLSDPNASVNITLSADSTSVPIVITYDDGSTKYLTYTFNYKPPAQPASQTCDYEEDVQSCPYGGLQTCTGTWQGGVCKYDGGVDPNCRNIRCNEPPAGTQPPPPSCGDYQYIGAECDWGRQQVYEVYQDACGNYDRRNYQTQAGQCGAPSGYEPPPAECEDVYYCENGTTIHKHGFHDGNTCQYAWDDIGEPC